MGFLKDSIEVSLVLVLFYVWAGAIVVAIVTPLFLLARALPRIGSALSKLGVTNLATRLWKQTTRAIRSGTTLLITSLCVVTKSLLSLLLLPLKSWALWLTFFCWGGSYVVYQTTGITNLMDFLPVAVASVLLGTIACFLFWFFTRKEKPQPSLRLTAIAAVLWVGPILGCLPIVLVSD